MSERVKLTKAQAEVLGIMGQRGWYNAYGGYAPTKKLVALGFAEARDLKYGSFQFTVTDAGRAYLAEGKA